YYREAYRRFLQQITNSFDFGELYSEILGELNASHTGGGGGARGAKYGTASLGAFFDDNYAGEGLLVTEVLKRGPLSTKAANVKPGDMILAIDGTAITPGMDYFPLLEGRQNHKTRISVRRADSGKTEDVYVKPVSQGTIQSLLYDRWVERNQAIVDSISGGRIAYVHIQGMNSPSYRWVFSELLGKYRNHEAVVVDTRWNGGGWLHNDIAVLLGGKEYVRFAPRGKYIGSEPFTQWTKPSAMLINESNYSDAHGTPYTYKTLGIGDLIGAPVPGTMTAVWWETQINGEVYFGIPQVTSLDRNGKPLENQQLDPDVLIYNNPSEVMQGIDRQLIGATRHLLEKLNSASSAK
ncbi:MAG: PDZ domain-containing protein, partial [Muribaculaceae bacterium]|nr:PDZ domain-containing protein [Muribaculaceae bacterium]